MELFFKHDFGQIAQRYSLMSLYLTLTNSVYHSSLSFSGKSKNTVTSGPTLSLTMTSAPQVPTNGTP